MEIEKLCACGCGEPVENESSTWIKGHHRRGWPNQRFSSYLSWQNRSMEISRRRNNIIPGCPPSIDTNVRSRAEQTGYLHSTALDTYSIQWDVDQAFLLYENERETSEILRMAETQGYIEAHSATQSPHDVALRYITDALEERIVAEKEKKPDTVAKFRDYYKRKGKLDLKKPERSLQESWVKPSKSLQDIWAYLEEEEMPPGKFKDWTLEELEFIHNYDGDHTTGAIKAETDRMGVALNTWYSIKSKLKRAGGPEELYEIMQESKANRYNKGGKSAHVDPLEGRELVELRPRLRDSIEKVLATPYKIGQSKGGRLGEHTQFTLTIPPAIAEPFINEFGDKVHFEISEDGIFVRPLASEDIPDTAA